MENTAVKQDIQRKQSEWHEQWSMLQDDELFLFCDWISPNTLEDLRDKTVLECGCGGGQHTSFVAPFAKHITSVDLNTTDIARERNKQSNNVEFVEADIAAMRLPDKYDVAFSIGVVHHTDDPDKTVANMKHHLKPGGRLIVWVYSKEGNELVEYAVEPIRKMFLKNLSRSALLSISRFTTALMYLPIYTVYMLPLTRLPFFEYFQNFRKLSFARNVLNVFDKLNAPQVQFISKARAQSWFPEAEFKDVTIKPYKGVSWCASGTLR